MMNREDFDLIEKYHLGVLSEEEKYLVEDRMKTDVSFSENVEVSGLVNSLVHISGLDMLREEMARDLVKIDSQRKSRNWKFGAGATGGLLLLASLIYYRNSSDSSKVIVSESSHSIEVTNSINDIGDRVPDTKSGVILSIKNRTNQVLPVPDKYAVEVKKIESSEAPFVETKIDTLFNKLPDIVEQQKIKTAPETKAQKAVVCDLNFNFISEASCKGENNGWVEVINQSVSGGEAPYYFKFSSLDEKSATGIFSNIGKGSYTIVMYDSKGCNLSKNVVVPEKICYKRKSLSFNPDYGETGKMAVMEGESGTFTIYNRAGMNIFKMNFDGSGSVEWSGINSQGTSVDAGLYQCIVEYSNGNKEIIEMTIVR